MSLSIMFVIASALIFSNAQEESGKVEVGSKIPSFSLKDQNGDLFAIDSVLGTKNLVIYFYPADVTPVCTAQACSFRDQYDVFADEDAIIIGISGQSVQSHKDFAEKYNLNFTLLADEGDKVRTMFGVPSSMFGMVPGRVTYVVDKSGKVVYTFDSQMQAKKHVENALNILKELK